mmetsp:Transcript_68673/g.76805  ORF Transcript_68673/g.76805 Transcript_68673/m.76805 type:complete len:209 (+) Transcript_68673:686-1312(+)
MDEKLETEEGEVTNEEETKKKKNEKEEEDDEAKEDDNKSKKKEKKNKKEVEAKRLKLSTEEKKGIQELERIKSGKEIIKLLEVHQVELVIEIEEAQQLIDISTGVTLEVAQKEMVKLQQLRKEIYPSDNDEERIQELEKMEGGEKSLQDVKVDQTELESKIGNLQHLIDTSIGVAQEWAQKDKLQLQQLRKENKKTMTAVKLRIKSKI